MEASCWFLVCARVRLARVHVSFSGTDTPTAHVSASVLKQAELLQSAPFVFPFIERVKVGLARALAAWDPRLLLPVPLCPVLSGASASPAEGAAGPLAGLPLGTSQACHSTQEPHL